MIGSDYILEAHNIYHTTEVRLRWKLAKFGEVFVICAWTFDGKLWLLWTFVDFWWLLWMKNDGFDSKMTIFSDRECFSVWWSFWCFLVWLAEKRAYHLIMLHFQAVRGFCGAKLCTTQIQSSPTSGWSLLFEAALLQSFTKVINSVYPSDVLVINGSLSVFFFVCLFRVSRHWRVFWDVETL